MSEEPILLLSVQKSPEPKWPKVEKLYQIYRDYLIHEDDLMNQRSTWHLLIQGFLFATFGAL